MDWSMRDQIQNTEQTMYVQKQKVGNQYQNISVVQGFSSERPNFIKKKGVRMKNYHNNLSTNLSSMQDDKFQSFGINTANDHEHLELPEEIYRQSSGHLFCKACGSALKSEQNAGKRHLLTILKQHLKGQSHAFFLQLYNNKSKAAILVSDAIKQDKIINHRGSKLWCRSCCLILEYNCLELLAGHLLSMEHQKDIKTGKNVMKGNVDELTVMSCQLCRAEVPGLNIDNHIKSTKHRVNVDKLEGGISNLLAFTNSNDMSPEEAIECGIVKVKDLMTYYCNACEKLLTDDGTINPLKSHLECSNHKSAACYRSDELKKNMNGILLFKFKANKMSDYLDEDVNSKYVHQDTASSLDTINQKTAVCQEDKSNSSHIYDFEKTMVPTWEEWKNERTCYFYNFTKNGCNKESSCERFHMCTHCQHSDHGWLMCTEQDKNEIHSKTKVPSWEEWKNESTCYFYNFNNTGCNRGVSCKRYHKCTHCQHLDHGWLKCTEQDKNEFRSKTKESKKYEKNDGGKGRGRPEGRKRTRGRKRRRRNEDNYQQDDMYKNEWLKPQGVEQGSKNRNAYASLQSIPKAPPPPAINDSYENKNFGYYEPQNSQQQYSTEEELNYFGRDYYQQESLHGLVETRDTFNITKTYNDHSLMNSEVYGYQNMESRMQPHPIRERNMERISTIRSTSKDFNQIIEPRKPFSPFEAVLILGCLADDLGIFGETVKAICKKALEDTDNILRVFKEDEIRMTMNVVADKIKALIESAVDKPSKEKFKLGLDKVILLLQHSVDA